MRSLTSAFQDVLDSRRRRPAYKVYAWDPATVTISEIASAISSIVGNIPTPLDITPYVSEITWSNEQLSFTMVDPRNLFHPDTGGYRNYLGDQAILRLVEGDEILFEADWITTFTGQIHGQVGWKKNRDTGELSSKVTVYGRAETQAFKRRKITSQEYTVGTELGVALYDICETYMGITSAEVRIPYVLGRQFVHKTNQLCQVTPWDGIIALLEVVGYYPYFDGEGKLSYVNKSFSRVPAKMLSNYVGCVELEVPENSADGINKVIVIFLDATLSQVDSPNQRLGTAEVTTGFFSSGEELECWWSEDKKQRAYDTTLVVKKSVNSGLLPVGDESYEQKSDFVGQIVVSISVWVPILATVLMVVYMVCAAFPNGVIVGGFLVAMGGITISIGNLIQAAAMIGILIIMMSMGSAQYEIWGIPFDYAYLEKKSIAIEDGLSYWLENDKEITNDFIGTHDQADTIAQTELIWEKSQSRPRRIVIEDDPSLELGDIIGIPDGRKILITGLSKTIKRGEISSLTIDGCKVMTA